MDITFLPSSLCGSVRIPSSKSVSHRALICAALAEGTSFVRDISISQDILATMDTLTELGASFDVKENVIEVHGISSPSKKAELRCNESGSTLRFIIPVACALGAESTYHGKGRLPERPINIYTRELSDKGITFDYHGTMPFTTKGKLKGGTFRVEGNVSSQFITGLLLALPLCSEDSEIVLTSPLQSEPYVNITLDCMRAFGVTAERTASGYRVKGGQKYRAADYTSEADFSQAAFFVTANFIGNSVTIENLPDSDISSQGDKKIIEIADTLCYNKKAGVSGEVSINASDIPDLVPTLAVLCSLSSNTVRITNAERLKIKESDRLDTTARMISGIGGKITKTDDGLIIYPVPYFTGGTVDSFNDHRIAMAAAIASTASKGNVTVKGFESIRKSYPDFLNDFINLGGKTENGITLE